MNQKKKNSGSVFLLLVFPVLLQAQRADPGIPVILSVFNESTAIPFTRFFSTPVHPGFQVGTEFTYKTGTSSRWFQTANVSYFYHNHLAQGIGVNTELGYEYRHTSGVAIQSLLGLGYMHTFATNQEYTFANGNYTNKRDAGNARLFPSLSFDIGYYIRQQQVNSPKLFVRYQAWAEYPYSPGFIPVMAHVNLHTGVKFFISKSNP